MHFFTQGGLKPPCEKMNQKSLERGTGKNLSSKGFAPIKYCRYSCMAIIFNVAEFFKGEFLWRKSGFAVLVILVWKAF